LRTDVACQRPPQLEIDILTDNTTFRIENLSDCFPHASPKQPQIGAQLMSGRNRLKL
jgi:hypothetical protein